MSVFKWFETGVGVHLPSWWQPLSIQSELQWNGFVICKLQIFFSQSIFISMCLDIHLKIHGDTKRLWFRFTLKPSLAQLELCYKEKVSSNLPNGIKRVDWLKYLFGSCWIKFMPSFSDFCLYFLFVSILEACAALCRPATLNYSKIY